MVRWSATQVNIFSKQPCGNLNLCLPLSIMPFLSSKSHNRNVLSFSHTLRTFLPGAVSGHTVEWSCIHSCKNRAPGISSCNHCAHQPATSTGSPIILASEADQISVSPRAKLWSHARTHTLRTPHREVNLSSAFTPWGNKLFSKTPSLALQYPPYPESSSPTHSVW